MKALNQHVNRYTDLLQEGEIQEAYKGILAFMESCAAIIPTGRQCYK